MRNYVFLLVFLISPNLWAQKAVYFDRLEENNGRYLYKGTPFTGVSIEKFDTINTPMIELNWKEGILHGKKTTWYKNKQVRETLHFVEGVRDGEFEQFYPNGSLKEKGTYKNDQLHGTYTGFYKNGQTRFVLNYEHGNKTGYNVLYFENGQMEQEVSIENGKINGTFKSWYPSGNPMKEIHYLNGVLHGRNASWHVDGSLAQDGYYSHGKKDSIHKTFEIFIKNPIKVESYKKGQKHGQWLTMGIEGDTVELKFYNMGVLDGPYISYHKGVLNTKGNYVQGEKDGFWIQSKATKMGAQEGTYKRGKRVGEWVLFDINLKELGRLTFDDNGELIDEKWYKPKRR